MEANTITTNLENKVVQHNEIGKVEAIVCNTRFIIYDLEWQGCR